MLPEKETRPQSSEEPCRGWGARLQQQANQDTRVGVFALVLRTVRQCAACRRLRQKILVCLSSKSALALGWLNMLLKIVKNDVTKTRRVGFGNMKQT